MPGPGLRQVPGHTGRLHLEHGHAPAAMVPTLDAGAGAVVKLLCPMEGQGGQVETRPREVIRRQDLRSRIRPRRSACLRRHRSRGSGGADAASVCRSTAGAVAGRSQPWLGVRRSSDVSPSPSQVRKVEKDRLSRFMGGLIGPGAGRAHGPRTNTQIVGRSDALDLGARTRQLIQCSRSTRRLSARGRGKERHRT